MKKKKTNENKTWKIIDAIFSAGILRLFHDSNQAFKENDDKKFNQLIYGSLFGIVFFVTFFIIYYMFFL